ncbi:Dyp-type peroxidase [Natronosalvus halobius]|uniref:Dyp-type peroxidase n=1 Tax=Natronosalvus halobius TaxID=2953746 RepID=UPI00209E5D4E|nr:Dyp-type peroxidase [Natronosalvus halobius]USZ72058.1 Dyp-type peroxidase [Natronosalvus halobius]
MTRSSRTISRRSFVRSAVAIGGASALSACLDRESGDADAPPRGADTDELEALPERQHAWTAAQRTDKHGNPLVPEHHVALHLAYVGDGPTDEEREQVETAFETLERAYARSNEGLLFTVGYGPAYFDRFDETLTEHVDLPEPTALAPIETPEFDSYDAMVHLASDRGSVVLSAEEALTGELQSINGVDVETTVEGILEVEERRTGFTGAGLPAKNQDGVRGIPDSEPVSEDAPMFMGFKSGFKKNQATEDRVTIQEGPFAEGTTTHLSRIRLSLDQWYEQDSRTIRERKMFCPAHADEGKIEGAGDNLGDSSQLGNCPADTLEDAREYGTVGHSQKSARARENDEPIILRRDFNSTDADEAGLHFLSHQRRIQDFVKTREAMNGTDVAEQSAIGARTNNGILQYMTVRRRANYLVPPRRHRSLPTPQPE